MKHQITIFIPSLGGGGAERIMVTIANMLALNGYSVDLVLARAEGPYLAEVSTAVNIVDLKASRLLFSFFKLVSYLRRVRPQTILSAMNYVNVLVIIANHFSRSKARVIVSERANLSQTQSHSRDFRQFIMPFLIKLTYPYADGIVANSNGVADDLSKRTSLVRDNIKVIYNPVKIERIQYLANEPVDHPWINSKEIPVLVGVGRLVEQKGFHVLISALSKVIKQQTVRLIILGEGKIRRELENQINNLGLGDYVCLPGFVANPYSWLAKARLFVFSSLWEGCPNALLEALACGVPVVSTNCQSGPAEILEGGLWGRLVPPGDRDALASAIIEVLGAPSHPNLSSRVVDFDHRKIFYQYLDVLAPNRIN